MEVAAVTSWCLCDEQLATSPSRRSAPQPELAGYPRTDGPGAALAAQLQTAYNEAVATAVS